MRPGNGLSYEQLAVSCWERVFRDRHLTAAQHADYVARGIEAAATAFELDAGCGNALILESLLLRMQAAAEANLEKRQQLLEEADSLHHSAQVLARRKISGL